jgi:hypothetical protein
MKACCFAGSSLRGKAGSIWVRQHGPAIKKTGITSTQKHRNWLLAEGFSGKAKLWLLFGVSGAQLIREFHAARMSTLSRGSWMQCELFQIVAEMLQPAVNENFTLVELREGQSKREKRYVRQC